MAEGDTGVSRTGDAAPDLEGRRIKVILILSMAYTGTTWITFVAGSHRDVLCLGAGDRILDQGPIAPERLCLVHGIRCRFWPSFFSCYDPSQSFFSQLAAHTGKRVFVINNPPLAVIEKEMRRPEIDLRVIGVVRDGRASLASAMRHHPHRVSSVYQSALAWLYRGTRNFNKRIAAMGDRVLILRYEDMVADPLRLLRELSAHTGLKYDESSLRYWEFEHHVATGNTGAVDTLIRLQGGDGLPHKLKDHYDGMVEHIRRTGGVPRLDESWRAAYHDVDLAAYDFVAGALYQAYGYPRPEVSEAARAEFHVRYAPPATPEEALNDTPPWRTPADQRKAKIQETVRRSPIAMALWRLVRPWAPWVRQ